MGWIREMTEKMKKRLDWVMTCDDAGNENTHNKQSEKRYAIVASGPNKLL